ncbi:hypothetical protein V8E51_014626 [Hyaloscypha variabilis]
MALLELFLWVVQQALSCLYSVTSFGAIARRYILDGSIRGCRSCVQGERPAAEICRPHGQELPRARASSTELRFCHECKEAGGLC